MNPLKVKRILSMLKAVDITSILTKTSINFDKVFDLLSSEDASKINDICNEIKDTKEVDYISDFFFTMDTLCFFLLILLELAKKYQSFKIAITLATGLNLDKIIINYQNMIKSCESSTESEKSEHTT